jgi:peptidoglycan/xylan/chitin deacetylase (PgdA/CDA1 family)
MFRMVVLMYHRVCPDSEEVTSRYVVSKSNFRKQMEFLSRNGYYTPTLDKFLHGTLKENRSRPIVITFDDGYLDNYENAFPVLQEFGFSALIFLVTDFSRSANWWDKPGRLGNAELLRPHHIQSMSKAGIQFGAHSFSHPRLPELGDNELGEELRKSKLSLENTVEQSFSPIAYPYGCVDNRVKDAVRRAGFHCGFAVYSGPLSYSSDLFEIRRVFMTNRASFIYLLYKAYGADHLVQWALWSVKKLFGLQDRSRRTQQM